MIEKFVVLYCHSNFFLNLKGSKICNSVWNVNDYDETFFGTLTEISVKKFQNKTYVHFENRTSLFSTQTFILCVQNESFTPEIQVILSKK